MKLDIAIPTALAAMLAVGSITGGAHASDRDALASIVPGVTVHGDGELLTQATANLVENALRHAPPGTRISVCLSREPAAGTCLAMGDDGPGVETDDLSRPVHRFYRGEHSRTTPGNGLGLSLVAAVADLHGATLRLRNAEPGLWVSMAFPVEHGA